MEKIWSLINGDVRKIGVFGMGGIGKTTVMKHINNRILERKNDNFDCIIWVTASKESSILKLQDVIGRKLGLDLSIDQDPTTRAGTLFKALKKRGRYLLIIDDLWEGYPLEDVGIPDPDDPTSPIGCKLVLTTRSLDVCRSIKCEVIKMNLLSKDEAWSLFLHHVGHDVLNIKYLEPIARGVASECARLPLAIATVGRSMAGKKETCEWRDALSKLRAFSKEPGDKGKRVIEQLKFSYDRLENRKFQTCLMFCALYPEDFYIDKRELVELLALEGIIEEKESKRDEIDEGHAMLNNIINQCLLEGEITSQEKSWVKMHDLVRDMVLQIDGLHSQYLAVSGTELRKLSHVKWSKDLLKIHISNCSSLNVSPMCPRLDTFILQEYFLENIPDSFFYRFDALKILNLSGCHSLKVLPDSISNLVNLVGLLLRDCPELRFVPTLAGLKNLRSLDLSVDEIQTVFYKEKSDLINVSKSLKELSNLRYLNLDSPNVMKISLGTIPRHSNLQYLLCSRFVEVSVSELMSLKNLEMFQGGFHDIHNLRAFVKHREQEGLRPYCYTFFVGLTFELINFRRDSFDKFVIIGKCNLRVTQEENDLYLLPKDVQVLMMETVSDLTSLCTIASLNYATDLQMCQIDSCKGVRELVTTSSSSSFVLQSLQRLILKNLENLEPLIGGKKASCNVFPCLQELEIYECPKMKVVFNIGLFSNLNNLKMLVVSYCLGLVGIVGESSEDINDCTMDLILPKLSCLRISHLPNLKSICSPMRRLICMSLKEIHIDYCPKLEQSVYEPLEDSGQPSLSASLQLNEFKLYNNSTDWEDGDIDRSGSD